MAFTFFFRDVQILETLVDRALPSIRGQSYIHVWDAGCAHGPEPYTLAILMRERMSTFLFRNVRIHCTDIDATFARQVREGIYPAKELERIPSELFARHFRPAAEPGRFQVSEEIRSRVDFAVHDLTSLEPIRDGLSLIVCKNVLLHLDEPQRVDVLRMFQGALRSDGLLAMEHTQKLPETLRTRFTPVAGAAQVYRKIEVPAALERCGGRGVVHRIDLPRGRCLPYPGGPARVPSGG